MPIAGRPISVVVAACTALAWATARADGPPDSPIREQASYAVTWTAESFPDAEIEARLHIADGAVRMSSLWATFFEDPRGWASFIRDLTALDADGRHLSVETVPHYGWRIGDGYSGPVTLRYRVDFSFANERWPAGNEQVALRVGESLYTTGLPLFIHAPETRMIEITIRVPPAWNVTTSWSRVSGDVYRIADLNRLLRNTVVIGRFHQETLAHGEFELRMALLGEIAGSADLVRETFRKILDRFLGLFGDRGAAHFTVVVIPGPNDGEAYFDSFASSQPEPPTLDDRLIWANSLAHELFHYWNGKRINSEWENRAERQWFSEGFSEYYANRALLETGAIDEDTYRRVLSQYLTVHLIFARNPHFSEVSIKDAGRRKWPNRPGVYDSGVAVAFCLDGLIREKTSGARTLDDFMRRMNERFGRTAQTYRYEDLPGIAGEVAGSDLSDFFREHVAGKTPLPVRECAERMNLTALVDGYHVFLEPAGPG